MGAPDVKMASSYPPAVCNLGCVGKRGEGEIAGHKKPTGKSKKPPYSGHMFLLKKIAAASQSDLSQKKIKNSQLFSQAGAYYCNEVAVET